MAVSRRQISRLLLTLPLALPALAPAQEADGQRWWFVFLERGKPTPEDKDAVAALQRKHLDTIRQLFDAHKMFGTGPLRDPTGSKRSMAVLRAASQQELQAYFEADAYVKQGYMTLNATPATAHKALNTGVRDPMDAEEVRIVQLTRGAVAATPVQEQAVLASLQTLQDQGKLGAWYSLHSGSVAHVLFVRSTDTQQLQTLLGGQPAVQAAGLNVLVWPQWLAKGVLN
jgi:uncharacterized protein YciI